jgi:hypothetical protein
MILNKCRILKSMVREPSKIIVKRKIKDASVDFVQDVDMSSKWSSPDQLCIFQNSRFEVY